jgi:hypothetical protein
MLVVVILPCSFRLKVYSPCHKSLSQMLLPWESDPITRSKNKAPPYNSRKQNAARQLPFVCAWTGAAGIARLRICSKPGVKRRNGCGRIRRAGEQLCESFATTQFDIWAFLTTVSAVEVGSTVVVVLPSPGILAILRPRSQGRSIEGTKPSRGA